MLTPQHDDLEVIVSNAARALAEETDRLHAFLATAERLAIESNRVLRSLDQSRYVAMLNKRLDQIDKEAIDFQKTRARVNALLTLLEDERATAPPAGVKRFLPYVVLFLFIQTVLFVALAKVI